MHRAAAGLSENVDLPLDSATANSANHKESRRSPAGVDVKTAPIRHDETRALQ